MKPGWAIIGKNKAKRPFERWEESKKNKIRLFLHDKQVIVDREAIIEWPSEGLEGVATAKTTTGG